MLHPGYDLLLEAFSDQPLNLNTESVQWAASTPWQGLSELLSLCVEIAYFLVYTLHWIVDLLKVGSVPRLHLQYLEQ